MSKLGVSVVAEEKERLMPKSRLESLSDLIFGLALSIGALTLIGQMPSSFDQLAYAIAAYGFSFFILIRVWYSYTQTMANIRIEKQLAVNLNILLLFLVSIEPFLFNELLHSSAALTQNVSLIYAFDLGGLFLILTLLSNSIVASKNISETMARHFKLVRNTEIIGTAIFFVSALPFFWTWTLPINGAYPVRFILWIIPPFLHVVRRSMEKK